MTGLLIESGADLDPQPGDLVGGCVRLRGVRLPHGAVEGVVLSTSERFVAVRSGNRVRLLWRDEVSSVLSLGAR